MLTLHTCAHWAERVTRAGPGGCAGPREVMRPGRPAGPLDSPSLLPMAPRGWGRSAVGHGACSPGPSAVSSLPGGAGAPSQTGQRSPLRPTLPCRLLVIRYPAALRLHGRHCHCFPGSRGPGTWTGLGGVGLGPVRGLQGHNVCGLFLVTCGLARLDWLRTLEAGRAHQNPRPAGLGPRSWLGCPLSAPASTSPQNVVA